VIIWFFEISINKRLSVSRAKFGYFTPDDITEYAQRKTHKN